MLASLSAKQRASSKYRKFGLLTDDMITDEHAVSQEALKRLPKEVLYGRYQRYRLALHYSLLREEAPKDKWTTEEQDKSYFMPFVRQVLDEHEEREKYDSGLFARQ